MKLRPIKNLLSAGAKATSYDIMIKVQAVSHAEAMQMQEAIESFASHFNLTEMKSAAVKLKNPVNRKAIKTFL